MLTPEQEKLFRFIYRYGKSYGLDYMEFEVEYDDYLSDEPFDINNFNETGLWGSKIEIPQKAAQELTDFLNEKVQPELQSVYDNILEDNNIDEASRIKLTIVLDFNSRIFNSSLDVEWYGQEDDSETALEMPENVYNEIQASVPEGNAKTAFVEYNGGGDSGEWGSEIEIYTKDGRTLMVPLGYNTDTWITNNLPGGWEIDEGSSGNVVFNLAEKEIDITHSWNTYDSATRSVLEFEF